VESGGTFGVADRSKETVTRRELGFLVIGLGIGLLFAVFATVSILRSLNERVFIISYGWDKAMLTVPLLLLTIGMLLVLYKRKSMKTNA
jgi:hypothetical protein